MSNSASDAAVIKDFAGAASIALRYAGFEQYQQAVMLFRAALGDPNSTAPPASPLSYSIRLSDSLELLCMWQSPPLETNCTIVYWAVGTQPDQIDAACAMLVAKGYTLLEAPGKSPLGSADKPDTQRAVLQDKSGHRIGVIINPPVPLTKASKVSIPQMEFPVEPTHIVNPPVTFEEGSGASAGS